MLSACGKHIDAFDTCIITAAAQLGTFEHIEVLIPVEAMALRLLLRHMFSCGGSIFDLAKEKRKEGGKRRKRTRFGSHAARKRPDDKCP